MSDTYHLNESRHGVTYLCDYYEILGVSRDCTQSDISKAYRKRITQYHPDRFVGLAPELVVQAERMARVITEANGTLYDPTKRAEYDAKLAGWTGPISTTGIPVVSLQQPNFGADLVLRGREPERLEALVVKANAMTGYNPTIFTFLEQQFQATSKPSPELTKAYREALGSRDIAMSVEESFRREALGMSGAENLNPQLEYLAQTEQELEERRRVAIEEIDTTLVRLGGGDIKLLGERGLEIQRELVADPSKALGELRVRALENFNVGAEAVRALAETKQKVMEQRLALIEGIYKPEQNELYPKLIVGLQIGEGTTWAAFRLVGETVDSDETVRSNELAALNEESAESFLDRGYNVMLLCHEEGLPAIEVLTQGVRRHFESYLERLSIRTGHEFG